LTETDWLRGDGLRSYFEETERKREDFSWLTWHLLGIANVSRRDVTDHSDWARFCGIALFMLAFSLYAFGGWLAFLSSAGVNRMGSYGWVLAGFGALLGAGATLTFDRVLVGTTKPKLDYSIQVPDVPGHDALPSFAAKTSFMPIVARMVVALVVGVFTAQAADLKLFEHDIDVQRRNDLVTKKQKELDDLKAGYEKARATNVAEASAAQRRLEAAIARQREIRPYSHGRCRRYLPGTKTPSRCWSAFQTQLAAQQVVNDLANEAKTLAANHNTAEHKLTGDITNLRGNATLSRVSGGGPGDDTKTLFRYLWDNPVSWLLYGSLLVLGLMLDLAAILLKIAGFDSVYERRQALRAWRSWWDLSAAERLRVHLNGKLLQTEYSKHDLAEQTEREETQTELERVVTRHRAIRDAYTRVFDDTEVHSWADEVALTDLMGWLEQRSKPDYDPAPGEPPAPDSPGANDEPDPGPDSWRPNKPGDILVGEHGGRWKLTREVTHQGGHATVWEAVDPDDADARVAIKIMPMRGRDDRGRQVFDIWSERARNDRKWLEDFAKRAGSRRHLVELADLGARDGELWHATWWSSRGTLHDRYGDGGTRSPSEVLEFARQIVRGLLQSGSSEYGFPVHGDLKPANLLLDDPSPDGPGDGPTLRIADWGLARDMGERPGEGHHEIATFGFAAPPSGDGQRQPPVHVLDDLFSIGAVIWWCLTGVAPATDQVPTPPAHASYEEFQQSNEELARARRELPRLHDLDETIPVEVGAFVHALLAETRAERCAALGLKDPKLTLLARDEYLNKVLTEIRRLLGLIDELEQIKGTAIEVDPIALRAEQWSAYPPEADEASEPRVDAPPYDGSVLPSREVVQARDADHQRISDEDLRDAVSGMRIETWRAPSPPMDPAYDQLSPLTDEPSPPVAQNGRRFERTRRFRPGKGRRET
jgi:serine/threonine protein kinase